MPEQVTASITLSPTARLKWTDDDPAPWQERWFGLGAERIADADLVTAFWRDIAAACITTLCHVANPDTPSATDADLLPGIPLPDEAAAWLAAAPPMSGGEYLSSDMLGTLWKKLLDWCATRVREEGGLAPFLQNSAPRWRQVGRVFFHLAENKMDELHPFAFLATYTAGLTEQGRPRHVPLARALQHYAGDNNRQALVRLLEPVQLAAERLPWVRGMIEKSSIYHPAPWTPDMAYEFLCSAPILEECGMGVRLPDWWKKRSHAQVSATVNLREGAGLGAQALLDFDVCIALGEERLTQEDMTALLQQATAGLMLFKGQWVEVDKDKLQQVLAHWQTVQAEAEAGTLSFMQGMRLLAGLPDSNQKDWAPDTDMRQWSLVQPGEGFAELLSATRARVLPQGASIPGLQAELRPYQVHGVAWLHFLGELRLGACLADDMGLGKTMQVLALLLYEKWHEKPSAFPRGCPTLLIVPASLMGNWHKEAARFAPSLRLALLHSSEMHKEDMDSLAQPDVLAGYDCIITTYAMCTRLTWLAKIPWRRVIVDEAQAIKNADTRQSRAVRKLQASSRIALTGTPIENSLGDLWALFDFLNPGLLGSASSFTKLMKKMAQSTERFAPLRRVTAPYILRRMKTDKAIISDLPDKIETTLYCHLTKQQMALYATVTEHMKKTLQELDTSTEAQNKRRIIVLQSLMLLKQLCNHPVQAGSGSEYAPEQSGKFLRLAELCADIAARQERVLVFTQFREIIAPLAQHLAQVFGRPGLVLHGGVLVKERKHLVDTFQQPEGPPFFILSLKAGGTGLTLTEASHVIHFDRWWNPAVEDQATDRAFRIGQKKHVLVHKCVTRGTLEEKIDALITQKRELAGEILGDGNQLDITAMSDAQILDIVTLDAQRAAE